MPKAAATTPSVTRDSGFSFAETYQLYNEQLHYARATYTRDKLDKWQTDWNAYFARYGMEIPPYAHRVSEPKSDLDSAMNGSSSNLLVA